jgi:RimJ/RimL family protein N-acetyltransferase
MNGMDFWNGRVVRLRALAPQDLDFILALHRDDGRARITGRIDPPPSRAALGAWLESACERTFADEAGTWVIEARDGNPAGLVSTHRCQPRTGTFGHAVEVLPEWRRRGFAHDALILVLRYYFDELRYQKSTVPVDADNEPSLRLHERLGFVKEGRLRQMVYSRGRFLDEIWFGITAEEFRGRPT